MKINDLVKKLSAELICGDKETEIDDYYIGDLLSHVMGKLPEQAAWLTIMNNINVAAVASLAGAACVLLCEGVQPDSQLREACEKKGVTLLRCEDSAYHAVRKLLL